MSKMTASRIVHLSSTAGTMSCTILTFNAVLALLTAVTMSHSFLRKYVPEGPSLFYLCHVSIIPVPD